MSIRCYINQLGIYKLVLIPLIPNIGFLGSCIEISQSYANKSWKRNFEIISMLSTNLQ